MELPRAIFVQYRNQFYRDYALIVYEGTGVGAGGSEFAVLGKNPQEIGGKGAPALR